MESRSSFSLSILSDYVGNDEVQVKEMIMLFLETIPQEIEEIIKLSQQEEWIEVYKIAHRIKPSFKVFAMEDILDDLMKIEQIAKENNTENSLDSHLARLSSNLTQVITLLNKEI